MTKQQSSYRQIFKATSIFGGVQVINVFTGILRSKFVAIFLGPEGMGISSLLSTTVTLAVTIAGMGLNFSAVRYISQASEQGDDHKLSFVLKIFKRWLWISCIIGAIALIVFSPIISQFTFGNKIYTLSFVLLSLMLVFTILTNGNTALLQGTRQLKFTAKSTVIGSVFGLITTIPIYYCYGTKGIVPSLIFGALITFLISEFYARKVKVTAVTVNRQETITLGREMAKLGGVMVIGQILGSLISYYIDLFIRGRGGLADVGLYQAGTTITNQSIGLVFTAMTMDYFPRLSAAADDNVKVNEMVNQQGLITVLIASPLLVALIVFAPLIIHILLSPQFYVITNFVRWVAVGTLFTAPSVVLSYISLAKGDKKAYFFYCTFLNSVISIAFYVVGYLLNRLIGMAIGMCLFQILYAAILLMVFHKLYSFSFTKQFLIIFSILALFCVSALVTTLFLGPLSGYLVGGLILVFSSCYSWVKLDKLIGLSIHIKDRFLSN
jgi:O-antigen/teichoic acid export membrane protein